MTRVKKNDLVKLVTRPTYYFGQKLDWESGIVVKGPYEESIKVTSLNKKSPVNLITLVCDIMANGVLYTSIPLRLLTRQ